MAQGHADQPIGLYEPGETARLGQNKGPKRCVAIHSTQPWRHSTSRPPVSRPCRDATHGKHVGGPTNTVPIRPQGLAQPCYLSHSWGFGVRVFLLLAFVHLKDTHKAVGQGLVVCQGVSTRRWAIRLPAHEQLLIASCHNKKLSQLKNCRNEKLSARHTRTRATRWRQLLFSFIMDAVEVAVTYALLLRRRRKKKP